MGRVSGTPHHPGGSRGQGSGESHHLHAGIIFETETGMTPFVFDSIGSASTEELEDGT